MTMSSPDKPTYPEVADHLLEALAQLAAIDPVATRYVRDRILKTLAELAFLDEAERSER